MNSLACVLLEIENLVNPEALTITSLLLGYIYILRVEVKELKGAIKANYDAHKKDIDKKAEEHKEVIREQTYHYRETVQILVEKNDTLHNEKHDVTREVIPLLVELIDQLDKKDVKNQSSNHKNDN